MRQITTLFLTTFYLFTTLGVTVNFHYCQGKISSVKVYTDRAMCCCGDENLPDSCCDDESFFYQLDDTQLVTQNLTKDKKVQKPVSLIFKEANDVVFLQKDLIVENLNLPPPQKQALWLLNCSLTYYG